MTPECVLSTIIDNLARVSKIVDRNGRVIDHGFYEPMTQCKITVATPGNVGGPDVIEQFVVEVRKL